MSATTPKDITRFAHVPEDLISLPRWVLWKYETRVNGKGESKRTKVPYIARANCNAKAMSNNPRTWSTYETCLYAYRDSDADGIGFMLGDGWSGVDLDHCIDDAGNINDDAKRIIKALRTYTEISPSGHGIKMICRGALPPGRRRTGNVEMYDKGRFFTITGNELRGWHEGN